MTFGPPPEKQPGRQTALLRALAIAEDSLLVGLLAAMIGFALAQIVLRNLFASGLSWADPLLRVLLVWLGMAGALVAAREDRNLTVDVLSRFLPERWRRRGRIATDAFTAAVSAVLAWHAVRLVLGDRAEGLIAFSGVPVWVCELALPLGFGLIAVRYALHMVRRLARGRAGGPG